MPRPKREGAPEPKKRSRTGCWPCKARKVKCGEEKPACSNCTRQHEQCDYSIRLNWGGRGGARRDDTESFLDTAGSASTPPTPSIIFPPPSALIGSFALDTPPRDPPRSTPHLRARSSGYVPPTTSTQRGHMRVRSHHAPGTGPPPPNHSPRPPAYPSPSTSVPSPAFSHDSPGAAMLPPGRPGDTDDTGSRKRRRVQDGPEPGCDGPSPTASTPLTPGSSGEDERRGVASPVPLPSAASDLRRLSVHSLLASPSPPPAPYPNPAHRHPASQPQSRGEDPGEECRTYGFDHGLPDLDIPRNDDAGAIEMLPLKGPNGAGVLLGGVGEPPPPPPPPLYFSNPQKPVGVGAYGTTRGRDMAFEPGGYYAYAVPIQIPRALEPLPARLLRNRMDLLYFHHFLNHTARILVPHDCDRNPFRCVLPKMAIEDDDLLSLLLAFSASHRARLLSHPEPATRIALLVQNVFPKLRSALLAPRPPPASALATAIMLASLEIIAPNTFAVRIPWRTHLTMARNMILALGGPAHLPRSDPVSGFLGRWFVYLDVLGCLSGRSTETPLAADAYWGGAGADDDDDGVIDCLTGFTTRLVRILARIAALAKACADAGRLDASGAAVPTWRPPAHVLAQAEQLGAELRAAAAGPAVPCSHARSGTAAERAWDASEIVATNTLFHLAGLIHLRRRVLNLGPGDMEVRSAVRGITEGLERVRPGSTAESCLVFPMFTAGCEALPGVERNVILGRLGVVEGVGMEQVRRARVVMQRVWETGRAWESLVSDEFFG
ncbi:hypothetical protein EJ06DRAFT_540806 [Trichodelitschia bisporula]|uniref:Zn(2)-C6 fungal-type domain-containing protein n=1 Tax=Trichodelitschia bisporula TaxID=703511 RepID=A0A6G1ICA9_9PEZI|nr:hypothetical protein EJ06DRAFT_540806 [Trichodelitschia bisporula]